ncbi:hypothetical protein AAFC00_001192 [Neodothiora populina]|uniref:Phosphoglycerate mutase-like protein n=1 Tax=Neodothiora populina TaxID=2781224 RepID=A0ABR3PNH0_9PEZI
MTQKKLHIVRHAQGYHEITPNGHSIHDPQITPLGIENSLLLRSQFPSHHSVDLLLASPLRRAIETALVAFEPATLAPKNLKVVCVPDAQEATAEACDTGSEKEVIEGWFGDKVDVGLVKDGWNGKRGSLYGVEVAVTMERARRLRNWVKDRPEKEVVLVSHGNFAHYLTGDVDEKGEQTTPWWINDEFRTFVFAPEDDEKEGAASASLLETEESVARRAHKET